VEGPCLNDKLLIVETRSLHRATVSGVHQSDDRPTLYQQQAGELDRSRREATLFKIQPLMVERTIYAPIWQLAFINGIGLRVGESGFGRIPLFPLHRAVRGHHDQGQVTQPAIERGRSRFHRTRWVRQVMPQFMVRPSTIGLCLAILALRSASPLRPPFQALTQPLKSPLSAKPLSFFQFQKAARMAG
jgi:hypothetical protein